VPITDLVQIRRLGGQKRAENEAFRKYMKRHDFVERRLRRIAERVEEEIDCTACGECCRVGTVRLLDRDVEHLAKFLRLRVAEFLSRYTDRTAGEGLILRRTGAGCVFLEGNECAIYEARPSNCADFPHLVRGQGSLPSRMWDLIDRACYCPIVYNALEEFKVEVGFARPK
jgi:hypothetical protein